MGDLDERADIAGDRSAPEHAERRQHGVIIRLVGIRRWRHAWYLSVRIADDRHHRYWRDPSLLPCRGYRSDLLRVAAQFNVLRARIAPGVRRERCRLVRAATRRIAEQLEAAAVRSQEWKIGVAGTAGLPGLARETRQRLRRRRKADCQEASQNRNSCSRNK